LGKAPPLLDECGKLPALLPRIVYAPRITRRISPPLTGYIEALERITDTYKRVCRNVYVYVFRIACPAALEHRREYIGIEYRIELICRSYPVLLPEIPVLFTC
jgi:hypothetical protein